ncbi:FAD-dependent oxidoreductase [candidate division KSB1 bacterium]
MTNQTAEDHRISGDVLIVGGGIAGITAAIEAAEVGKNVILIEKNPYIGGRVVQMNQYFPKLCPPSCGMEINLRRIKQNPRIKVLTLAQVENVTGESGNYQVTIKTEPRFVNEKCTVCDKCVEVCPAERENDFNIGMDKTKAIYIPYENAFPSEYVLDMNACKKGDCKACVDACKYNAIELDMQAENITAQVSSIVLATGWKPFDPSNIEFLGFGKYPNVVTSLMMERLASPGGPTGGKILRPSDNKEVNKVAFVQCVGSRDENHLPYCSAVCCMASMKQTTYIRSQYPDAEISIFYIDVRSPGRLEDFYANMQTDEKVTFHRGKVADITEDPNTKNLNVRAENTLQGTITEDTFDMVILAVGIEPHAKDAPPPVDVKFDDYGFVVNNGGSTGIYGAGTATKPMEVAASLRDAMGATLKALQATKRD